MSRQIDFSKPLSAKDKAYLAERGVTAEQQAERQEVAALLAETITHDEETAPVTAAYLQRIPRRI